MLIQIADKRSFTSRQKKKRRVEFVRKKKTPPRAMEKQMQFFLNLLRFCSGGNHLLSPPWNDLDVPNTQRMTENLSG
jgi:hypothetical protein